MGRGVRRGMGRVGREMGGGWQEEWGRGGRKDRRRVEVGWEEG